MPFLATAKLAAICACDKTPTIPAVIFEVFLVIGTAVVLRLLARSQSNVFRRYGIVAVGVFIFEFFTSPMWINSHLGQWAYVYQDVSWVLTMGWSTLILFVVTLVDQVFAKRTAWQRFGLYLVFLTYFVIVFESLVVQLGIRTYAVETMEIIGNRSIPLLDVPVHIFYYVPAFTALVIGFYKYWSFHLEKWAVVPVKKNKWLRNIALSLVAVVFFELMIDPMVVNANLPGWSYMYRDISIIMSGIWIVAIWLATTIIDRRFIHWNLSSRFLLYLLAATMMMTPIEAWLIRNGFRVYGPSASANFSGITAAPFDVPVEVLFAVPMYLALVISLIRYWQIILDNSQ